MTSVDWAPDGARCAAGRAEPCPRQGVVEVTVRVERVDGYTVLGGKVQFSRVLCAVHAEQLSEARDFLRAKAAD